MDLNAEAIQHLEKLKFLRQNRLQLESWDVNNQMPIGSNKDLARYNFRKKENVIHMSENIKMVTDIKDILKYLNRVQPIKIPLQNDSAFARIAQGAIISSAVLPSGLQMYHSIDDYEWVVRGNFAVIEQQFILVD